MRKRLRKYVLAPVVRPCEFMSEVTSYNSSPRRASLVPPRFISLSPINSAAPFSAPAGIKHHGEIEVVQNSMDLFQRPERVRRSWRSIYGSSHQIGVGGEPSCGQVDFHPVSCPAPGRVGADLQRIPQQLQDRRRRIGSFQDVVQVAEQVHRQPAVPGKSQGVPGPFQPEAEGAGVSWVHNPSVVTGPPSGKAVRNSPAPANRTRTGSTAGTWRGISGVAPGRSRFLALRGRPQGSPLRTGREKWGKSGS